MCLLIQTHAHLVSYRKLKHYITIFLLLISQDIEGSP